MSRVLPTWLVLPLISAPSPENLERSLCQTSIQIKLDYHHQNQSCSASHWHWRQKAWLPSLLYMVSASLLQGQGTAGDPTLVLQLATSPESPACSLQVPFTLHCSKILEFLPALKVSVSTSPASTYIRQARLYILLWLH